METTTSHSKVKELSQSLLQATLEIEQVKAIIDQIHTVFQHEIGLSGNETDLHLNAAINTQYGKALGLAHAAQCLLDYHRTRYFLGAIVTAIRQKQIEEPGKQIQVFYAGCGPYAPFVTLVAPLFKASEVQFSILEVNVNSLQFAKDLITKLGLEDRVQQYYHADAITFNVPDATNYDILISETLDALLYRECYVPILCNLLPQFSENAILIPENVQIKMSFLRRDETGKETEDQPVVVFDSREAAKASESLDQLPDSFEPKRVPVDRNSNIVALILDTEVHVYKDFKLFRQESALTRPYALAIDPNVPFANLVFTYHLKPQIELFTGTE